MHAGSRTPGGSVIPELALEAAKEVLPVLVEALTKGVGKETLLEAIKGLIVEASDAEMAREFPGERP